MSANRSHTISPPDIGSVFSFFGFGLVSAFGNEKGSFSTSFSSENISVNKKSEIFSSSKKLKECLELAPIAKLVKTFDS